MLLIIFNLQIVRLLIDGAAKWGFHALYRNDRWLEIISEQIGIASSRLFDDVDGEFWLILGFKMFDELKRINIKHLWEYVVKK